MSSAFVIEPRRRPALDVADEPKGDTGSGVVSFPLWRNPIGIPSNGVGLGEPVDQGGGVFESVRRRVLAAARVWPRRPTLRGKQDARAWNSGARGRDDLHSICTAAGRRLQPTAA